MAIKIALLLLCGCTDGPGFFSQEGEAPNTVQVLGEANEFGGVAGQLKGNSGFTQIMSITDAGDLSGSAVSFPPGALVLDTVVTLESGVGFGAAEAAKVGLRNISAASPNLIVSNSSKVDSAQPFSIEIPFVSKAGLLAVNQDTSLITVIYKVSKHSQGGKTYIGIIPNHLLSFTNKAVRFDMQYFGSYQVVYAAEPVKKSVEEVDATPIVTKAQAANGLNPIKWKNITISVNADREIKLVGSFEGYSTVDSCLIQIDRDKSSSWDIERVVGGSTLTVNAISNAAHTVFGRLDCLMGDGQSSGFSSWSPGADVAAIAIAQPTPTPTPPPPSPPDPTFDINGGDDFTNSIAVTLDLADSTGVDSYRTANGADCSGAIWNAYVSPINVSLDPGDGSKTVCMQVRDSGGNTSATATDGISLDTVPPALASTTASELGPNSTSGSNTDLTGTSSDATSGIAHVKLAIFDGTNYLNATMTAFDSASAVWLTASGTATWTLSIPDSVLVEQGYNVNIRATDQVGNQNTISSAFNWDSTAPTITVTSPAANTVITTSAGATSFALAGACGANGEPVDIVVTDDNGDDVSASTTCSAASWSGTLNLTSLVNGPLTATVSHWDAAGNEASVSENYGKNDTSCTSPMDTNSLTDNGDGSVDYPYVICSLNQLDQVRQSATGGNYFVLGADIDASPTSGWDSGDGFFPIGGSGSPVFDGNFNGNGHVIDGLYINRPLTDQVGLFGGLGAAAVITKFGLEQANISGRDNVGAVVGETAAFMNAVISGVYATGRVEGRMRVGGLVGFTGISNSIENAYFIGHVSTYPANESFAYAGGIAGISYSDITNVYTAGLVDSRGTHIGGIAGKFGSSPPGQILANAFSVAAVRGDSQVGGLVGYLDSDINNSIWFNHGDNPASCVGTIFSGTDACTDVGSQAGFYLSTSAPLSSWDFANIWEIPSSGSGFPTLMWQSAADNPIYVPETINCYDAHTTGGAAAIDNFGSETSMTIEPNSPSEAYITFDLANIAGVNNNLSWASLSLNVVSNNLSTPSNLDIHEINSAWDDLTITDSSQPTVEATPLDSLALTDGPAAIGPMFSGNQFTLFSAWLTRSSTNYGLKLKSASWSAGDSITIEATDSNSMTTPSIELVIDATTYTAYCTPAP